MSHLDVAIVGAGAAGVYTAAALRDVEPDVRIDVYERLSSPYGLVRHGVAPDHPDRIARLTAGLDAAFAASGARLLGGVEIGTDITVTELRERYAAVVIATGARHDAPLDLPGPATFGAADFVAWYSGHPDARPDWPLTAESVAVIGAGNVALDITRMLATVTGGFAGNAVRDIHLFARRGPADTRFSAYELGEIGDLAGVDVVVDPADLVPDRHMERMTRQFPPVRKVVDILREWSMRPLRSGSRRVHPHFYRLPAAVLGADRVEGLRTERAIPDGYGRVDGSGEYHDHPVQAVYRAVGYVAVPPPGVPCDPATGAMIEQPGLYVTGWAKRGGVGLVASTRAEAAQTARKIRHDLVRR